MPREQRPSVTEAQLLEAATHVCYEWDALVDVAVTLDEVVGARSSADNNAMESLLLHYRCMVNFLCGGFTGRWNDWDIQPQDFVGRLWFPPEDEWDRHLRGRLPVINEQVQHLSWRRVLEPPFTMWSTVLLAHEVTYTMSQFHDALDSEAPGVVADLLGASLQKAIARLPDLGRRHGSEVPLAPARVHRPPQGA